MIDRQVEMAPCPGHNLPVTGEQPWKLSSAELRLNRGSEGPLVSEI